MRYRCNDVCPDEQTDKRAGWTAQKHNAFTDIVRWQRIRKQIPDKVNESQNLIVLRALMHSV